MSRLPLRGLVVFEAVARLGSFKAAASELNLTPSGVSHQMSSLEKQLGTVLVTRDSHRLTLSSASARYAKILTELLGRLDEATCAVTRRRAKKDALGSVRIMAPPSLAAHWLMPRLPAFIGMQKGVDVRVLPVAMAERHGEHADVTIVYGGADRWKRRAVPLLEEVVQPYCAPSRLSRGKLRGLADLAKQPLISSCDNDWNWESWFRQRGAKLDLSSANNIQIDPSRLAIEAAVEGVGFVLEGSTLTQDHVAAGRLVSPGFAAAAPSVSYWLLPLRQGAGPASAAAYDWLLEQAALP